MAPAPEAQKPPTSTFPMQRAKSTIATSAEERVQDLERRLDRLDPNTSVVGSTPADHLPPAATVTESPSAQQTRNPLLVSRLKWLTSRAQQILLTNDSLLPPSPRNESKLPKNEHVAPNKKKREPPPPR